MADKVFMPRALDDNGDIVPGALAYFYERGTTDALTVYTDDTAATAHSQPVIADSTGTFPAVFTTSAVKMVLTDASAVELPGSPFDPAYLSSATTAGAGDVTFSPITGNTATTVQGAIANLTGLWNAVTTFGRSLIAASNAPDARTVLGLGGAAEADVLDEDDMASNSASEPPSQQSTKAYVDAQVAAPKAFDYDSGEQTLTLGTQFTDAHGLGAKPKELHVLLRCKVAEHGYGVEEDIVPQGFSQNGILARGVGISADGTNVYVRTGTTVISSDTSGNLVTLTAASWRIIARARA